MFNQNDYQQHFDAFKALQEASKYYNMGERAIADRKLETFKRLYPKFPHLGSVLFFQAEIHLHLQNFLHHDNTKPNHVLGAFYLLEAAKLGHHTAKIKLIELFGLQGRTDYLHQTHQDNTHDNYLNAVNCILKETLGENFPPLSRLHNTITPDFVYKFICAYLKEQKSTLQRERHALRSFHYLSNYLKETPPKENIEQRKQLLNLRSDILFRIIQIHLKQFKKNGEKIYLNEAIRTAQSLKYNDNALQTLSPNTYWREKNKFRNRVAPTLAIIETWETPNTILQNISEFFRALFFRESYWLARFNKEVSPHMQSEILEYKTHRKRHYGEHSNTLKPLLDSEAQKSHYIDTATNEKIEIRKHHSGASATNTSNDLAPDDIQQILQGFEHYQERQKERKAVLTKKQEPKKSLPKKQKISSHKKETPPVYCATITPPWPMCFTLVYPLSTTPPQEQQVLNLGATSRSLTTKK